MNDFSENTEEFLYSKEYKEPKKLEFLDVSGSMGSFRILPDMDRGGESIEYPSTAYIHLYDPVIAARITEQGRCILTEMMDKLVEERKNYKDGLNRSRNRMARIVLRGSSGG